MKSRIYYKGITLIELLVSTAVMSIILLMATGLQMYSLKAYKHDDVKWQLQQDARYAVQQILKEARKNIVSAGTGDRLTIDKNQNEEIVIRCINNSDAAGLYRQEVSKITGAVTGENKMAENILEFKTSAFNDGYIEIKVTAGIPGSNNVYSLTSGFYSRAVSVR